MSKLEELIQELCPDGVEYKKLGEVATISRGGNLQKKDFTEKGIPCIHYGQIYTKYGLFADTTFSFISEESAKKQKYAEATDIVMAVTSENIEDVCKCVAWLGNEPVAVSGHTAIIHHNQNPRYMCYYFHSSDFQAQKNRLAHGTKVMEVTPNKLTEIVLPVPPLPIQCEIVRILDNFTELTSELQEKLTAELTTRKKQYEYYRDSLLSFDQKDMGKFVGTQLGDLIQESCPDGVKFKHFGKMATIVRGASPRPIKNFITTDVDGVNWIKIGDVKPGSKYITETAEKITPEGAKKSRFVKEDDFILSNSMSFGRPYIMKTQGCIHDGWLAISDFENYFISDFLYHLLNSNEYQQKMRQKASFGGAVQNLNADIVRELEMPVIPLPVQREIVRILDRFDALCNDLTSGLTTEIEARQKQYEYYRDRLLSFKETNI